MEGSWRVGCYGWRVDAKAESGKNEGFSGLGIRGGGELVAGGWLRVAGRCKSGKRKK
jgi:hypothetical protein